MMNNSTIEQFYKKIDKHIKLFYSYLEDPFYELLIKSCRLKPQEALSKSFKATSTNLQHCWVDEFGATLRLEGKKVKLYPGNVKYCGAPCAITDFFFGEPLDKIFKRSILLLLTVGENEDVPGLVYSFLLLDNSNYFRAYIYAFDKLEKISPLYFGIKNIKKCFSKYKSFVEIKNKSFFPSKNQKTYIIPISDFENFCKQTNNNELIKFTKEYKNK